MSLDGKRVVIADDEGMTLLFLRKALTGAGMVVVGEAQNGRQAMDLALRERPDLVILDIEMPGMDGLEAARRILEGYSVCIVFLTAYKDDTHFQQAWQQGACGYLTKPLNSKTLIPLLERIYLTFPRLDAQSADT